MKYNQLTIVTEMKSPSLMALLILLLCSFSIPATAGGHINMLSNGFDNQQHQISSKANLSLTDWYTEGTTAYVTFTNRSRRKATFDFGFMLKDATNDQADKVSICDTREFAPNRSKTFSIDLQKFAQFDGKYQLLPCYRIKGGTYSILDRSIDFTIKGGKVIMNSPSSQLRQGSDNGDNVVREVAEQMPEYTGGMEALKAFFDKNIRYPEQAKRNGQEGMVILQFVVEKDGSLSNITVTMGKHELLNDEAVRVCKMVRGFKPGRENNQPVRVKFTYPYRFKLP